MNRKLFVCLLAVLGSTLAVSLISGCNQAGQSRVRLEHVAINVADPAAMAQWWCENLGMKVMREGPPPVNMRFIADTQENMMLELYNNPPEAVPDYANQDPLILHIAFMVDDVEALREKLLAAGATPAGAAGEITVTEAGDTLTILRDPWGVPIQLLKRAQPMLEYDDD